MTRAPYLRLVPGDVGALGVTAVATNAVVDGRRPDAQPPCQTRHGAVSDPKLTTRVTPSHSERNLRRIKLRRASAAFDRIGRLSPAGIRGTSPSRLKAASDHMDGHPENLRQIAQRTVSASKLHRLLMPLQDLNDLPIA